jgi:hypothetical protein
MSSATPPAMPEYEFSNEQNQVIGDLARKMSLVGFALMLFGILQIASGITTFIGGRNPQKILAAAKDAGVPAEQLAKLESSLTSGGLLTPFTVIAFSTILVGVLLLMVGAWNQQAANGFAGMVLSKGQDIARLMDALGALRKKYTLIYNMIMIFAIFSLISLVVSLIHWFKGS